MEKKQLFKKNDLCRVKIEDIGKDGEGSGKYDGFPLFIKDAVSKSLKSLFSHLIFINNL